MMVSLVLMVAVMVGCKKSKEEIRVPAVAVLEDSVTVTHNSALLYAEVTDNGGAAIHGYGFCYGKLDGVMDTVYCAGNGARFFVKLTGLSLSTNYVCKAFADNDAGRGFSEVFGFATQGEPVPMVKTYEPIDITDSTALAIGCVVSDGGHEILERGICYSIEEHPTMDGSHVTSGSGLGRYECLLTDLVANTKYNIRAYVVCSEGVYYGNELYLWTEVLPMEVQTIAVADLTASRVRADGKVVRDGGCTVTECGFCWGIEHNPTIDGLHIKASVGLGEFSHYFSGLEQGRTNYVRAYAINEKGITYGEELEFVPNDSSTPWSEGTLPGFFSVGPNKKVRFSQGNLQYYPDERIWGFAERQWDFVGGPVEDFQLGTMSAGTVYANGVKCDNTLTWKYYEGWMDLFGWGTSGWDNGNLYYKPYDFISHQYDCASYGPPGNFDLTGDYAEADWGIHNTISNGGARQWRTPTVDELVYLLTERETVSGMRFTNAVVGDVRGMIVLPDNWEASIYPLNAVNEHRDYNFNKITSREWLEVLEPAGAAFLPASGGRFQYTGYEEIWFDWYNNEDAYSSDQWAFSPYYISGSYWTTTQSGVNIAHALVLLGDEAIGPSYMIGCIKSEARRCNGRSVRLISDE